MFKDLPGNYQRGILLEASIHYQGHTLSKYNKPVVSREKFMENMCEKLVDKAQYYSEIESNLLYMYPLSKDRIEYVKQKALEYAKTLDTNYLYLNKSNGR